MTTTTPPLLPPHTPPGGPAAPTGPGPRRRPRAVRHRPSPAAEPLAAGAQAPPFALRCGPHRRAALDDYRGRPLVLAFYAADWHPVCTAQLERFRDLGPDLERLGAALVAISADTIWSHAAFARAHGLQFPLLADDRPRGAVARAYGVYDASNEGPRRALFVIDARGTVTWSAIFPEALDPGVDGILTALEALTRGAGPTP
jgi:peroxiredoxin